MSSGFLKILPRPPLRFVAERLRLFVELTSDVDSFEATRSRVRFRRAVNDSIRLDERF